MGNSAGVIALHDFNYLKIWHDITGPITATRLNLDLIMESKPKPIFKKYVKRALIGLQQIDSIVSRFPKPESPVQGASFYIKIVIQETVKGFMTQLERWGISLILELKDDALIQGEKSVFVSILTNLIQNTISAFSTQHEDGDNRRLEIVTNILKGKLVLIIIDNAGGIPKLVKQKLFYSPVTTKTDGHGYGLLLVKRQVEDMLQGTIICTSKLGKGTEFKIILPCKF